jgi:hypothetical protein
MNDYIIEDGDFLTKKEQMDFVMQIFGTEEIDSQKPKWRLTNIQAILAKQKNPKIFPYQETPLAFDHENAKPFFQVIGEIEFEDFKYIFDKFCIKHNIKYDKILRSRIVVLGMNNDDYFHYPHVDTIVKHDVFLYYLNDSDGDTIFFNKFFGEDTKNAKIIKTVTPKMGKAVRFNGHQFHSSYTTKKNAFRCILNVDYTLKKES